MKKQIIILGFLFSSFAAKPQSQLALEEMKHYRIQLDNRSNRHLKDVPKQLLEGYCKGFYKAYYPLSTFTEVNFDDFLEHFRWSEPVMNESVLCGEDYCSNPAFSELFSRFNMYLDYYETNSYNFQTSLIERKVEFVQLTYSIDVSSIVYTFKGPLFRMDEIEKTVLVRSESNTAVLQSIKYTFDLARYYSVEITNSEFKTKEKRTDRIEDNQGN